MSGDTTAARYNIQIRDNETFSLALTYKDSNGIVIDLTGYTARMQVRDKAGGTILLDTDTAPSSAVITGSEGRIDVTYAFAHVNAITAHRGVYDLALTAPGGVVDVLLEGSVGFVRGVTE